jgi:hypothetical protein
MPSSFKPLFYLVVDPPGSSSGEIDIFTATEYLKATLSVTRIAGIRSSKNGTCATNEFTQKP